MTSGYQAFQAQFCEIAPSLRDLQEQCVGIGEVALAPEVRAAIDSRIAKADARDMGCRALIEASVLVFEHLAIIEAPLTDRELTAMRDRTRDAVCNAGTQYVGASRSR